MLRPADSAERLRQRTERLEAAASSAPVDRGLGERGYLVFEDITAARKALWEIAATPTAAGGPVLLWDEEYRAPIGLIEASDGRVAVGHSWTQAEREWLMDYAVGWSEMTLASDFVGAGAPRKPAAVSVTDFGALGDGANDDTEAFQAAQKAAVEHGHPVVYVPAGHYIATITGDNRVSWLGERQQTTIQAAARGEFAITYANYTPTTAERWQRPFLQGIAVFGTGRTRGGIRIENKLGVDLIDVVAHDCTMGIQSAENFYGTWDRLFVLDNEIGIHFTATAERHHTGNKRIFAVQIRLNGIGVLVENRVSRTVFYGGTVEANRSGVVFDFREADHWNDVGALHLRDMWFEDNAHEEFGPARSLRDGTAIPTGDLYVHDGTVVLQNCGASYARVGAKGRLFSDFSFVGRGPLDAVLEIEEGGYFEHTHSLVPAQVARLSIGSGDG